MKEHYSIVTGTAGRPQIFHLPILKHQILVGDIGNSIEQDGLEDADGRPYQEFPLGEQLILLALFVDEGEESFDKFLLTLLLDV